MEEKRRYKAVIAGKEYTIVGKKSDQHMDAVVTILNHQLDQLIRLDGSLSKGDLAILMTVNAISDQLSKEHQIETLQAELDQLKAASSRDQRQGNDPAYPDRRMPNNFPNQSSNKQGQPSPAKRPHYQERLPLDSHPANQAGENSGQTAKTIRPNPTID